MSNPTFVIDYGIYFIGGNYESHTIKVKKPMSELHAKVALEGYLKKKHANFQSMVIHKCVSDIPDIFSIFGEANPFI